MVLPFRTDFTSIIIKEYFQKSILISIYFLLFPNWSFAVEPILLADCEQPEGPHVAYLPGVPRAKYEKWPPDVVTDKILGANPRFVIFKDENGTWVSQSKLIPDLKKLAKEIGVKPDDVIEPEVFTEIGNQRLKVVEQTPNRIVAVARWPVSFHTFTFYPHVGTVVLTYQDWVDANDWFDEKDPARGGGMSASMLLAKCDYLHLD